MWLQNSLRAQNRNIRSNLKNTVKYMTNTIRLTIRLRRVTHPWFLANHWYKVHQTCKLYTNMRARMRAHTHTHTHTNTLPNTHTHTQFVFTYTYACTHTHTLVRMLHTQGGGLGHACTCTPQGCSAFRLAKHSCWWWKAFAGGRGSAAVCLP